MDVDRVYKTGLPSKKSIDMGDFTFMVRRTFRGAWGKWGGAWRWRGRWSGPTTATGGLLCEIGVFSLIDVGEWADEGAELGARVQSIR